MRALFHLSDNLFEVLGANREDTGAYLNGATVNVTLVDAKTGVQIGNMAWPITLSYVAGSNGDYRATIPYNISVTKGQYVIAQVSVDGGPGLKGYAEVPVKVIVQKAA